MQSRGAASASALTGWLGGIVTQPLLAPLGCVFQRMEPLLGDEFIMVARRTPKLDHRCRALSTKLQGMNMSQADRKEKDVPSSCRTDTCAAQRLQPFCQVGQRCAIVVHAT
jgi:hypothetical protein